MKDRIDAYMQGLQELFPDIVEWRRYLHQHPELSFQEKQTARFVAQKLEGWGIKTRIQVGGGGVVAEVDGEFDGPTVALRADMDALPIQDEKDCVYKSKVPGVMHACGHDGHTSVLLGLAQWFQNHRELLHGRVRFIFQHAEEVSPGGAKSMIEDGALENVDVIYGVHLWSGFPVGHVYNVAGPIMAAADEFSVIINGKGGHGALPHETIDSVVVASHVVINAQSIVSRMVDPLQPAVISFGSFHGGSGFNVIADQCELVGTLRSFEDSLRKKLTNQLEATIASTCAMFGAQFEYQYKFGYPPVINHKEEVARFFEVAPQWFGSDRVLEMKPMMGGEDFSYYLQEVPGCFMFVGAGNEQFNAIYPHHHPKFDIDEQSMLQAAQLLLSMTLDYMEKRRE